MGSSLSILCKSFSTYASFAFQHDFLAKAVPRWWASAHRRCDSQFYYSRGAHPVREPQGTVNILDACGTLADLAEGARGVVVLPAAAAGASVPNDFLRNVRPLTKRSMPYGHIRGRLSPPIVDTFRSRRCDYWRQQSGQPDSRAPVTLASPVSMGARPTRWPSVLSVTRRT